MNWDGQTTLETDDEKTEVRAQDVARKVQAAGRFKMEVRWPFSD